jgi:hypothetical protein
LPANLQWIEFLQSEAARQRERANSDGRHLHT